MTTMPICFCLSAVEPILNKRGKPNVVQQRSAIRRDKRPPAGTVGSSEYRIFQFGALLSIHAPTFIVSDYEVYLGVS